MEFNKKKLAIATNKEILSQYHEITLEAEAIRIYLEIKGGQWINIIDEIGVDKAFKTPIGIDLLKCTMTELKKFKPESNAQKLFREQMIKMRSGEIPFDVIELGKSGVNKKSSLYHEVNKIEY